MKEVKEIIEAIEIERDEEGSWWELFQDHGISADKRVWLGIGIQFMQQMTGVPPLRQDRYTRNATS